MLYPILLTIYLILFAFLTWRKFDWSIYLIIASLPSYLIRFEIFGIPMTLLELIILILFFTYFFHPLSKGGLKKIISALKNFKSNPFFWPIVAILIFATGSIFISPNLRGALGIWKAYFIEPILFFIVLINCVKNKKQLHLIFWALGISALYISIFALWQFFSAWGVPQAFLNPDGSTDRVVSIFGYPNALGLYLGPIVMLFVGFLFLPSINKDDFDQNKCRDVTSQRLRRRFLPLYKEKIKRGYSKLLKIIIITLSFITIILAESESAIIAILVTLIFWGLLYHKTRLLSTALIIIFIALFFLNPFIKEFLTTKLMLQDWSGVVRRHIWQETGAMIKDNWFWGAGLAGYQTKIIPYHIGQFEIFLYPHNIILNFWSELGLLGLFSFIWLAILYLWRNLKEILTQKEKLFNLTLIMITLEIFIHGLVDVPYFKNDLAVLFWIIIAFFIINQNIKKHRDTKSCV